MPGFFLASFLKVTVTGVELSLQATPNASKSEITSEYGDRVKIKLKAKPVDGAANKELVRFLSKTLDIPKSGISIVRGLKSRKKTVQIDCDAAKRSQIAGFFHAI